MFFQFPLIMFYLGALSLANPNLPAKPLVETIVKEPTEHSEGKE